ncbi:hypothetical protein EHQ82_10955 [Leptospira selangorensis]|uniref:SH3 domain-containing protein n=1 Tax=Leptospira selangorensis TaxID=2484982 RepID=A0ABY2NA59_9LEPT|nr:hypothetical protein [Leptospira selangorensis]TGM19057.1 hypothetical protein EHQ82_10955 [Leptospira selangorensis]
MKRKNLLILILVIPFSLFSEPQFFGGNNLGSDEMVLKIEESKALYYFNGEGDGCEGFQAKFSKQGENFHFTEVKSNCNEKRMKDFKCVNEKDTQSLIFSDFLKCDNNLILYNKSKKVIENQSRNYYGINAVSLGLKSGIATSNLKYREKPDIQSKTFTCYFTNTEDEKIKEKEINFIPKDTNLTIIAKTLEEYTIGDKRNFWYLVFPSSDSYNGCLLKSSKQKEGWVFGEYIKIEK